MENTDPSACVDGLTQFERKQQGKIYHPLDSALCAQRAAIRVLMKEFNTNPDLDYDSRVQLMHKMLGTVGEGCYCETPMRFDYGYNVHLGNKVFTNFNFVCLDTCPVHIGDNTMIGPNCSIFTVTHPLHPAQRNTGLEYGKPVTIGKNVWLAGNVTVLPGVTIGDNCVIGAGSIVTRDVPANSLAVGNPCRVLREITDSDRLQDFPFPDADTD